MSQVREKELNSNELENISELEDEEYNKFVDRIVKANREIFVLCVLENKPMCGYDVIKEIFLRCNVFLSQGNVYPILYSLEEEGILRAEFTKGNMRSKLYFIVPEQRDIVQKKIDLFVKATESMLFFVKR
jgi:PadR family transcriptional regulator, regulatory protein PadR